MLRTERSRPFEDIVTATDTDLHVPALCEVEVTAALRRALLAKSLAAARAAEALEDYLALPLTRHGHQALLGRALGLRDRFSAYDAIYVALAERLDVSLLTADGRLARAVRSTLGVDVVPA